MKSHNKLSQTMALLLSLVMTITMVQFSWAAVYAESGSGDNAQTEETQSEDISSDQDAETKDNSEAAETDSSVEAETEEDASEGSEAIDASDDKDDVQSDADPDDEVHAADESKDVEEDAKGEASKALDKSGPSEKADKAADTKESKESEKTEAADTKESKESEKTEAADSDKQKDSGEPESEKKKPVNVSQTVKAGNARITAEYSSDVFAEDVELKVKELKEGSKDFSDAKKAADKVTERDVRAVYAYDITFLGKDGKEYEPTENVRISIEYENPVTEDPRSDLGLVHINDKGKAEVIDDTKVSKDATTIVFENDEFSVYVVVNYSTFNNSGTYQIKGDETTYNTLAGAAAKVMSSGELIVVTDDCTEAGGQTLGGWKYRIVPGEKDVTIVFDGDLTINDSFSIGGANSQNNITVKVTGDFTLKDGVVLTIGKGGTLSLNPNTNNSLEKSDVKLEDDGKIEGYTFPETPKAFVVTTADDISIDGKTAYETLEEAYAAAGNGDVILVTEDTVDASNFVVKKDISLRAYDKDVKLKAKNGYKQFMVDSGGKLHLGSGAGTPVLTIERSNSNITVSAGTLEVNDGAKIIFNDYGKYLEVYSGGTLDVKGGLIEQTNYWNGQAVSIGAASRMKISGGVVSSLNGNCNAVYVGGNQYPTNNPGHLEISGGLIEAGSGFAAVQLAAVSSLDKMTGGTIRGGSAIKRVANANDNKPAISGGILIATNSSGSVFGKKGAAVLSGSVKWQGKYDEDEYTVAEGFEEAEDTVSVDGYSGSFHYLNKQLTVTYNGNGGKTAGNKTEVVKSVPATFKTAENEFVLEGEVFKEWNTDADGNGTGYAEDDEITIDENLTLYAIWETPDGPVSINGTKYQTIQDAVDAASDGDIISVDANVADTGNVKIDKNLTIVAGNDKVVSSNANLIVDTGKTLTLGNGSSDKVLNLRGSVTVTDGNLVMKKGVSVKRSVLLKGSNVSGTFDGAFIDAASGNALYVANGAHVNKIHNSTIIAENGQGIYLTGSTIDLIENSTVKAKNSHSGIYTTDGAKIAKITGGDTLIQGSGTEHGLFIGKGSEVETIENGRFIVDPIGNSYAAAVLVGGSLKKIDGGYFKGGMGIFFQDKVTSGCDIENATIIGDGDNFGNGLEIGNPDALSLNGTVSNFSFSLKNVSISSSKHISFVLQAGNHITSMENVTVSGRNETGPLSGFYVVDTAVIDKIKDCDITRFDVEDKCKIGSIENTKLSTVTIGNTEDDYNKLTTVGEIKGGSISGKFEINAVINEIDGTNISCTVENGTSSRKKGEIKLITGDTKVNTTNSYAINNSAKIGTIQSGDFEGGNAAIYNVGTIEKIAGGDYIGNGWFSIWNNNGTIDEINIAEKQSLFKGPWSGIGMYNGVGSVSGHAVFIASDTSGKWKTMYGNTKLETGGSAYDLSSTNSIVGYGRYYNAANNGQDQQLNGTFTLPTGYHMSYNTTKVSGIDGDFHYLVKDHTVIYDGNGHNLNKGEALEGFDNEYFKVYNKASIKLAGNVSTGDFHFNEKAGDEYYVFAGWNTEPDGSGTAYAAGATLDFVNLGQEDVKLYAQWKHGPVNINQEKEYEDIYSAMLEAKDGDVIYVRGLDVADDATDAEKAAAGTVTETKTITVNKNVTIAADPASPHANPVSVNANFTVNAGKTLTMGDSEKSTKTLTLTDSQYTVKGKMVLNDYTEITQSENKSVISVNSEATLAVNGGSVTSEKGKAVYNNGGTTTIAGGTITANGSNAAVDNRNNGTLAVTGGTITATKYTAIDNVKGTITEISGGTITGGRTSSVVGDGYRYGAVRNEANGTINKISGDVVINAIAGAPAAFSNEGTIKEISGGTFNGAFGYAFYNGKTGTAKIDQISGGTFRFADTSKGTAFRSENGTIGKITGGTYSAMAGISLSGGTIEEISGGSSTSTTNPALKIEGGLTVPEISGGSFVATGTGNSSIGIQVASGSKVTEIKGLETVKGLNAGLQVDSNAKVGTITNCKFEGTETGVNRNGIYMGASSSIETIKDTELIGRTGIYMAGSSDESKKSDIGSIEGVTITSSEEGIRLGGSGTIYNHIGEIKGGTDKDTTKIIVSGNKSGIFMLSKGAAIDKISKINIESKGTGISNQAGTIKEIVSAGNGDVTIKSKDSAIHNYDNGTISSISGFGIYETEGASAIVNTQGSKIKLESDGDYNLDTSKPNVGYGSYKSSNAKKVIDDASKYDITDGYAMSKITHGDGYYHLVKQLKVTFDPDEGTPDPDDQTVGYGEKASRPETDPAKTGYAFVDWFKKVGDEIQESAFDFINTAIEEDTVLKAKFNEHTYTIKFDKNADDAVGETEELTGIKYTEKTNLPENGFTRAGYDFTGWNNKADGTGDSYADGAEVEKLTAENNAIITMYAKWTPRRDTKYTVEHYKQNTDGLTYALADTDEKEGITDTTASAEPKEYVGFTFNRDAEETKRSGNINGDGSLVLKLYYDRDEHKITFDSDGGSAVPAITQLYGTDITAPADPVKTGYTFGGWDNDVPATMPSENLALKARWTANTYKIHFDKNSAAASGSMADQTFKYDEAQDLRANSYSRKGYTFTGWNTKADGSGTRYADKASVLNVTADDNDVITMYAVWTADDTKLTYDANGGRGSMNDKTGKVDETVKTSRNGFTRKGYTFTGWNTKADGSGDRYAEDSDFVLTADANELYAQWRINSYTVNFDSNGGSKVNDQTIDHGSPATQPAEPSRDGYTFDGWYLGSKPYDFSTPVTGDITLTAHWTKDEEGTQDPEEEDENQNPDEEDENQDPGQEETQDPEDGGNGNDNTPVVPADTVTPAGPAAPAVPAAAQPVPQTQPDQIDDEPVPQAEPETTIEEPETPKAEPVQEKNWALLNLIAALLSAVGAALALRNRRDDDDYDDDGSKKRKLIAYKAAGIAAAVVSVIAFLLTEDMSSSMVLADKWTILMAVLLAGQAATAAGAKKAAEDDGEED